MTARLSRWCLFALCATSLAICIYDLINQNALAYRIGMTLAPTSSAFNDRVTIVPGGPAAKAGIRTGDIVNLRELPDRIRYHLLNSRYVPGGRFDLTVMRNGVDLHRTIVPVAHPRDGVARWVAPIGAMWTLLFCVILIVRSNNASDSMILTLALICWTFIPEAEGAQPAVDFISGPYIVLRDVCVLLFRVLPIVYILRLAPHKRSLQVGAGIVVVAALISLLSGLASVFGHGTGAYDPRAVPVLGFLLNNAIAARTPSPILQTLFMLTAIRVTTGAVRSRIVWIALALVPFYCVNIIFPFLSYDTLSLVLERASEVLMPLVLSYALLNRRLMDAAFILNRTAVFSGVSIVIIGTFVLVEWAVTEWLSHLTRTENVAISAATALVLGLSIRLIHTRVDRFVDTVFFRKRHEDERAIRQFAAEAPYITDGSLLLERAVTTVERHADASFCRILLENGHGSYGEISENDPAILRLRATHDVLDLHDVASNVAGELAFPMVARGRLAGVLIVGGRKNGERYAADETAAIAALATSVGASIELLSRTEPNIELLEAIRALPDAIAARLRIPI